MTNPNNSAFPADAHTQSEGGLTKREYFAAMAKYDENEFNVNSLKKIVGTEPPNDTIDNFKWWIEAEAMVKVMKADALIEALNKTPNHESI